MRKFLMVFLLSLLSLPLISGDRFFVGISGGYYNISDSALKDIYGSGNTIFGGVFGANIWKGIEVSGSFKFFSMDGKETLTKEPLKLSISPLTISLKYRFMQNGWKILPYVGGGIDYYSYKEDVVNEREFMKDTSDTVLGYSIQGGSYFNLSKNFLMDFNLKYTVADAKPYDIEVKLGGFELGIGALFKF